MEITIELITSVVAVSISAVGLLITLTKWHNESEKQLREEFNAFKDRIDNCIFNINTRLSNLEGKQAIFGETMLKQMALLVKQPIHFEKDELIDKLVENRATANELVQLKIILENELKEHQKNKSPMVVAVTFLLITLEEKLNRQVAENKC